MTADQTAHVMALVRELEELCDEGNWRGGTSRQFVRTELEARIKRLVEDGVRLAAALKAAQEFIGTPCKPEQHSHTALCRHVRDVLASHDARAAATGDT